VPKIPKFCERFDVVLGFVEVGGKVVSGDVSGCDVACHVCVCSESAEICVPWMFAFCAARCIRDCTPRYGTLVCLRVGSNGATNGVNCVGNAVAPLN